MEIVTTSGEKITGCTQLMLCVLKNDLNFASKYLSEINAKNSIGWTALHIACRNSAKSSSIEMVEFLLKHGADPNARTNLGWTPLHMASKNSNDTSSLATVELLFQNGAVPINEETKKLKSDLEIRSLRDKVTKLEKDVDDMKKLLREHFDCAPDGPLYIEAKSRFENKNY